MSAIKPIHSDHPAGWHWDKFIEFSVLKARVGEPTPHMRLVQWASRGIANERELLWRAGCYGAGYSFLTAEAIWREWPYERVRLHPDQLLVWLREHWAGIHTRTPRRCVRTPEKFHRCLMDYLEWLRHEPRRLGTNGYATPREEYEAWWESLTRVTYMGRYISIRLLELFRRWGMMQAELYDIRAIGAHSPIRCLCLLYPEHDEELRSGDPAIVDAVASTALSRLRRRGLPEMRPFDFAAILCEYRSSYENRGDYPGNQTDEELGYQHTKYAAHWEALGHKSQVWEARRAVSEEWSLGELHGWTGQRKLCGSALHDHGVVWSDERYDYAASLQAGRPIEKEPA